MMSDWLITGSRHGYYGLWEALDAAVRVFGSPTVVHVREQRGVDQDARAWVHSRGLQLVPHAADPSRPSPDRYHEANQRMVDAVCAGGLALGFPGPKSRGTWDCLRRARERGLACYVADGRRLRRWGL